MKIQITLKDPDGVSESVLQAAKKTVTELVGLSGPYQLTLVEIREAEISEQIQPWVEYGEYVTIEIDTVAKTAIVCPVKS